MIKEMDLGTMEHIADKLLEEHSSTKDQGGSVKGLIVIVRALIKHLIKKEK